MSWAIVISKPRMTHCALFTSISNTEMIMLEDEAVWKYDSTKYVWNKFMDLSQGNLHIIFSCCSAVFDKKRQCIYLCTFQSKLFEININKKKINMLKQGNFLTRMPSVFSIGHDDVYVLSENKKYLLFNKKTKSIVEGEYSIPWTLSARNVTLKKRKSMITTAKNQRNKVMLIEYSFTNNAWIGWNLKQFNYFASEIVKTSNEQYLILLGGYNVESREYTKDIIVFDLNANKLSKSYIKLPISYVMANIHRNKPQEKLLLLAYINQLWRFSDCRYIKPLPFYFMELIGKWICLEYLHVIGQNMCHHWSINVDEILKSQ